MCHCLLAASRASRALHWRSQQQFLYRVTYLQTPISLLCRCSAPRSCTMASRPAVLPETYGGDGSFSDWCDHFESVAQVNGWDNAAKSLWLRVRLVGRAQSAYKRLSEADHIKTFVKFAILSYCKLTQVNYYVQVLKCMVHTPQKSVIHFILALQINVLTQFGWI